MTLTQWHRTGQLDRRVQLLKAVAHPLRLCLIATLAEGACNVGELSGRLAVAQPLVSQQLRVLRMMKLVGAERRAGHVTYRLTQPHLRGLLACMDRCCSVAAPSKRAVPRAARA